MYYINLGDNSRYVGIKSFKEMSSRRKRRCINYQISFNGSIDTSNYDIQIYTVSIPSINYRYSY